MADAMLTIWNNNDKGGNPSNYYAQQGVPGGSNNSNCLQTQSGAWVLIFSKNNYDASQDILMVPENAYLDDLSNVDGENIKNWKNDIGSFILYDHKPAWWDAAYGSPPSNHQYQNAPNKSDIPTGTLSQLFDVSPNQVWFFEEDNFQGSNGVFTAPYSGVNCLYQYYADGKNMDDQLSPGNISSFNVGSNAWLVVFTGSDGSGYFMMIDPSSSYLTLSNDVYGKNTNWDNSISSFFIYSPVPAFWGLPSQAPTPPYVDFTLLSALYPSPSSNDDAFSYYVEDAKYKITSLEVSRSATQDFTGDDAGYDTSNFPTVGWTCYHVELEHPNTGGASDKAKMDIFFANDGSVIAIQNFYMSNADDAAFNINETTIKAVDLTLKVIGLAADGETDGISSEVTKEIQNVFDNFCGLFNKVCAALFKFTDDGGRFYFIATICHTFNRISSIVFGNYNYPVYSLSSDPRYGHILGFEWADFPTVFGQQSGIAAPSGGFNWSEFDSNPYPYNQVVEVLYNSYHYRTWYHEVSLSQSFGLIVSCKIDYEKSDKDDHVILIAGFTAPPSGSLSPVLTFAQATIQFVDNDNDNISSDIWTESGNVSQTDGSITQIPNCDIVTELYNQLSSALSGLTFASDSQGSAYLADITKANLNAIIASTTFSVPST